MKVIRCLTHMSWRPASTTRSLAIIIPVAHRPSQGGPGGARSAKETRARALEPSIDLLWRRGHHKKNSISSSRRQRGDCKTAKDGPGYIESTQKVGAPISANSASSIRKGGLCVESSKEEKGSALDKLSLQRVNRASSPQYMECD
jgi:hypothetical protein